MRMGVWIWQWWELFKNCWMARSWFADIVFVTNESKWMMKPFLFKAFWLNSLQCCNSVGVGWLLLESLSLHKLVTYCQISVTVVYFSFSFLNGVVLQSIMAGCTVDDGKWRDCVNIVMNWVIFEINVVIAQWYHDVAELLWLCSHVPKYLMRLLLRSSRPNSLCFHLAECWCMWKKGLLVFSVWLSYISWLILWRGCFVLVFFFWGADWLQEQNSQV